MCTLCQSLDPTSNLYDFHDLEGPSHVAENTVVSNSDQSVGIDDGDPNGKPVYTLDQIAYQLTNDYWSGDQSRAFQLDGNRELTVNINALTNDGKFLARNALDAWSEVTGITFTETSLTADITFDDNQSGAFASSVAFGGQIYSSNVNVSTQWLNAYGTSLTSYNYQTYIHEIGHALGLGHGGNYNGSASYSSDAHYANESWQTTIMSYFSETQNTFVDANFAYVVTPQMADILAIQNLYGSQGARAGNTVYGNGATSDASANILGAQAATIYDSGGTDHINLGSTSASHRLDLNAETFSDLNGRIGNLGIARDTVIENATLGSGNDTVIGNQVANTIVAGSGADTVFGRDGNDSIEGGNGNDTLDGGAGNDSVMGGSGTDEIFTGSGQDLIYGGADNDLVSGGGAADVIYGDGGADEIYGGSGNDVLRGGDGNDKLVGGTGADIVYGQAGQDTLFGGDQGDQLYGGGSADKIFGQLGNDTIDGGNGNDFIAGNEGNDRLIGGYGADVINGGSGNDKIYGGFETDFLNGDAGDDVIWGQDGDDRIDGGTGNDIMGGGSGADRFVFRNNFDDDTILDFVIGDDMIDLSAVSAITSFTDLQNSHLSTGANGAEITVGADVIVLEGIDVADLSSSDFLF